MLQLRVLHMGLTATGGRLDMGLTATEDRLQASVVVMVEVGSLWGVSSRRVYLQEELTLHLLGLGSPPRLLVGA
ncbi:hypothetical protein Pmani_031019 [Petrolisthes manimaculis]|uniref:Uncharacterized protein n=1 Tax=Petrolisthes manimaculis TaxID=1843537 RepID=A0AAE1NUQ8_9EUCA|nr:hypothetical protein Pmani_031019 [Petrolisthes manimaculis]